MISFFAFQDIITAVTGIVLLIALLMALQITKPLTTSAVADRSRVALRDTLREELARLKLQAATAHPTTKAVLADDAALQAEAANLNELAEALDTDTERIARSASNLDDTNESDVDVEAVRRANEQAAAELKATRMRIQERTDQIEEARLRVEHAEQAVLAELRNTQDLWLIPERSRTSKEPVLISVFRGHFSVQSVDARDLHEIKRRGSVDDDLGEALKELDPSKQYVVFYFRPSSLGDFDTINEKAKALRYEIGYDLVDEDAQVRFAVAPEIVPPKTEPPVDTSPPAGEASAEPQTHPDGQAIDIRKELEKRGDPVKTGSGFLVSSDGIFVTNDHVVAGCETIFVGSQALGWRRACKIAGDESLDLALLKIEGADFQHLPIARSESVRLGQTVATIGFPNTFLQGISPKCTKGEIASLAGLQDDPDMFQISVSVQPGNSGGPLFDLRGNVVGVVSGKINMELVMQMTGTIAENVNFAIKSAKLLDWIAEQKIAGLSLPPVRTTEDATFEDVVSDAEQASVMILVYP
ncbi:MAG: trypsin-like peptidase domain-containing protein [Chthoniobacterales bacterium]|nr:trypsin-like peptidase domain-containing protein [Chthoniobacterales bacterium]